MCIIAIKPADIDIDIDNLYNMWVNNPHGAGLMYAKGGNLVVTKGLMTFSQFLAAYRKVRDHKTVIHFRWRTHGPLLGKLTHPFHIRNNVAMVHNGIIPTVTAKRRESDTSVYARVLQDRYEDPMVSLESLGNRKAVLKEIGLSKLVFMNGEGKIQILNEQMGHWGSDGCWYSNHTYTDHRTYDKVFGALDYDPENWKVSSKMITL